MLRPCVSGRKSFEAIFVITVVIVNNRPREKLMICIPHLSSTNCNADDEAILKAMKQELFKLVASVSIFLRTMYKMDADQIP